MIRTDERQICPGNDIYVIKLTGTKDVIEMLADKINELCFWEKQKYRGEATAGKPRPCQGCGEGVP